MRALTRYISRFSPTYPASLVYMLQSSEYDIREYLEWLGRVENFHRVSARKQLVRTAKAKGLLAASWVIIGAILVGAMLAFLTGGLGALGALAILLLAPYILGYGILAPLWLGQQLIQRPKERASYHKTQQILQSHPAVKIAIAGSYGKTSMREIVSTVLAQQFKVAAAPHSYNTPLGIASFVNSLAGDEEVLVFELGEYYPGDVRTLSELVGPSIGIVTGVNEAHLSKFKTLERTSAGIFELADYNKEMPLYVNGESELAASYGQRNYDPAIYSRGGIEGWKVSQAVTNLDGTSFVARKAARTVHAKTDLLGFHQIGPICAAIMIAEGLGMTDKSIEQGIAAIKPFEHRMEMRRDSTGIYIIDDSYNGNPDGAKAIIEFLKQIKGHRRLYVTPGFVEMGSRTSAVHRQLGRQLVEAKIEVVGLVRNSVTGYIEASLKQHGFAGEILWFDDGASSFSTILQHTKKDDVVVFQNDWPDNYS